MSPRQTVVLALLLGLLVGGALAIGLPREQHSAAETVVTTAVAVAPQPAAEPKQPRPSDPIFEARPPVRIALRAADPGGGAPWAVRVFDRRVRPGRNGSPLPFGPWMRCAQLGRIVDGRFGWITESRGFDPVRPTEPDDAPGLCRTRRALARSVAAAFLISTVRTDRAGQLSPAGTVAFGLRDGRGRSVDVLDRGRPTPSPARDGAFLAFTRTDPGPRDLRLRVPVRGARPVELDLSGAPGVADLVPINRRHQGRSVPGSERVAVRTPDPAGGPAFGLLLSRSSRPGDVCISSATRLLGRRSGFLDRRLELLRPNVPFFTCPDDRHPLTRSQPLTLTLERAAATPGEGERAGRVERRTLPGVSLFYGRALPGVRSLEIITPSDIRTLIPDPRSGAWITAYDGDFPGETLQVTATLFDGTHVTQALGRI